MESRSLKRRREESIHSSTTSILSQTPKCSLFYDAKPAFRVEYTYPVVFYLLHGNIALKKRLPQHQQQRLTAHNAYCERKASWEGKSVFKRPIDSDLQYVWPSLSNVRNSKFPTNQLTKHSQLGGLTDDECLGLVVSQYQKLALESFIERLAQGLLFLCSRVQVRPRLSALGDDYRGFPVPLVLDVIDQVLPGWLPRFRCKRVGTELFFYNLVIRTYGDGAEAPRPEYLRKKLRVSGCQAEDYVFIRIR